MEYVVAPYREQNIGYLELISTPKGVTLQLNGRVILEFKNNKVVVIHRYMLGADGFKLPVCTKYEESDGE